MLLDFKLYVFSLTLVVPQMKIRKISFATIITCTCQTTKEVVVGKMGYFIFMMTTDMIVLLFNFKEKQGLTDPEEKAEEFDIRWHSIKFLRWAHTFN